jgi:hypothetical protein
MEADVLRSIRQPFFPHSMAWSAWQIQTLGLGLACTEATTKAPAPMPIATLRQKLLVKPNNRINSRAFDLPSLS